MSDAMLDYRQTDRMTDVESTEQLIGSDKIAEKKKRLKICT